MSDYSTKLKDPRWQKKRLEVMQRDGFKCVSCGDDSETLHVHHCYYVSGRSPWDYESETLITLCVGCHETIDMVGSQSNKWALSCELAAYIQCNHDQHMYSTCGKQPQFPILHRMLVGIRKHGGKICPHRLLETLAIAAECGVFTDEKIREIEGEAFRLLKQKQPTQTID